MALDSILSSGKERLLNLDKDVEHRAHDFALLEEKCKWRSRVRYRLHLEAGKCRGESPGGIKTSQIDLSTSTRHHHVFKMQEESVRTSVARGANMR